MNVSLFGRVRYSKEKMTKIGCVFSQSTRVLQKQTVIKKSCVTRGACAIGEQYTNLKTLIQVHELHGYICFFVLVLALLFFRLNLRPRPVVGCLELVFGNALSGPLCALTDPHKLKLERLVLCAIVDEMETAKIVYASIMTRVST